MSHWLVDRKIAVARIPDEQFDELSEYAMTAIDNDEPVGDDPYHSINTKDGLNGENAMSIPLKFSSWFLKEIDNIFILHKPEMGVYGIDSSKMKITQMWVNRMKEGDQHQLHTHMFSMYSFAAYIDVRDDDAPFAFVNGDYIQPISIDYNINKHVLFFPSTLMHTVYRKNNNTERISVSGNVALDPYDSLY